MPCRKVGNKKICSGPRTDWWLDSMGIDWYSPGGGSDPVDFSSTPVLAGNSLSNTENFLSWNSVTGVTNSVLEVATDSGFSDASVILSANQFTFVHTGTLGQTRYYRVKWQGTGYNDSSYSNTVTLTFGTIGAAFWLRADSVVTSGSEVTEMSDKSPNNRDALPVAARNTPNLLSSQINGHDVVDFVRADTEILTVNLQSVTTYTYYIIFKADEVTNNQSLIISRQNGAGSFVNQGFGAVIITNQILITNGDGSSTQQQSIAFTDTASYHLLEVKFQSNGSLSKLVAKLDGVQVLGLGGLNAISALAQNINIGAARSPSTSALDGKIAEIIFKTTYDSNLDENVIINYLNDRYALSIPLSPPTELGVAVLQNISYSSTIDSISNLYGRLCYDDSATDQPIVVIMHGFSQEADDFTDATLQRMEGYGWFVAAIGMRERDGASGTADASARELYDIRDAFEYIKANFASSVNEDKCIIIGYSGGGGNVLGFISKFPDYCSLAVDFFGISDYGYDGTFGWWQQTPTERANIENMVGDTPANFPNQYKSRQHMFSASNFKGRLLIYHDASDPTVQVNHSQRTVTQLIADGFSNYVYNESTSADSQRWIHGLPNVGGNGEPNIDAEPGIDTEIESVTTPTMPTSGTLKINGYLRCELFEIWLGNGTAANDGQNRRATLVYDFAGNSYTVTPSLDSPATDLTVAIEVLSGAGTGNTASGTISTETEFNPA